MNISIKSILKVLVGAFLYSLFIGFALYPCIVVSKIHGESSVSLSANHRNSEHFVYGKFSSTRYLFKGDSAFNGAYYESEKTVKKSLDFNYNFEDTEEVSYFGLAGYSDDSAIFIKNRVTFGAGVGLTQVAYDFKITPSYALLFEDNKFKNSFRVKATREIGLFSGYKFRLSSKGGFVDDTQKFFSTAISVSLHPCELGWTFDYKSEKGISDTFSVIYMTWNI